MTGITRKQFINYAVLPGIRPRLQELIGSGFQYIPFFIALVYQSVRLLPVNHPYTNPINMGRFGIRHVIAEAANNLTLNRKNIDQILLFITILIGLVLIMVQFVLFGMSLLFPAAMAAMPTNFAGFFLTPAVQAPQDIAYILLDMVFGVPGMFDSCVALAGTNCTDVDNYDIVETGGNWILASLNWPFPVHLALHQMFQLYSTGLLVIATMITTYFIITILMETAQTGQAFGKRFNKVWAPVRIVVAFGLLIPVGFGLNSSQYIVLYAAKFGSGFATNGWNLFNTTLGLNTFLDSAELVSQPNIPEVGGLLQFMYTVRTCVEVEEIKNGSDPANPLVKAYLVKDPLSSPNQLLLPQTYENMINFLKDGSGNVVDTQAIVRFGVHDPVQYPSQKGNVFPRCGEIAIPLPDPRDPNAATVDMQPSRGAEIMQRYYWFIIRELYFDVFPGNVAALGGFGYALASYDGDNFPKNTAQRETTWDQCPTCPFPPPEYKVDVFEFYSQDLENAMLSPGTSGLSGILTSTLGALEEQRNSATWNITPALREKGWAGAGIWYNKIAELSGAITSSTLNIPIPTKFPYVMEYVQAKRKQQDQDVSSDQRFAPVLASDQNVLFSRPEDQGIATAMWKAFKYWQEDDHVATSHTATTGNAFYDAINALLGTEGLYSMRRNQNVHPLAQLVGVGRSLVESSIKNFGMAAKVVMLGAAASTVDNFSPGIASMAVGILMTITLIGLTAGFILFYVVPFLPFIYFYFAVGGWIKGIFEAMVGAPLWALAHIRIDGNGLPGQAAVNGYFLIFEIFLRPILIVFGLLASISIFGALVSVLNETWDLVVSNLTGFDVRAEVEGVGASELGFFRTAIDEFFFTVIYAIIVFLMGMSSFKLIDLIPNNILRWMGQSVATFNDQREDAAQSLVGTSSVGAQQAMSTVGGGLSRAMESAAAPNKQG